MTMLKRVGLAICVALGLHAISGGTVQAQTTVPMATWGGNVVAVNRVFIPALEEEFKKGSGNLKLQVFPGGQLAEDKDMPVSIPSGQVKLGMITVNGWTGTVPDTKVFDAPTGLTMQEMAKVLDGPNGLLAALRKKYEAKNSLLLAVADMGPPAIVSNKPISSPEDLKGVKIRVFSEGQADVMKSLGASPVKIAFAELYTALQHGTVDAAFVGVQGLGGLKLYETAKFAFIPSSFFGTTMMGYAANRQWVNSLKEGDRKEFLAAATKAADATQKALIAEIDQHAQDYRAKGMTVTFLTSDSPQYAAWQKATAPFLEAAVGRLSPEVRSALKK